MRFTAEQAIQKVKDCQVVPDWVKNARENHKILKAIVYGENFKEVLIEKIEKIESTEKSIARQKYSKDIRDLLYRILKVRDNVFEANGGSEKILINHERVKEEFIRIISSFKSNKSLFKYLSEYFFQFLDTDPNSIIFLEYKTVPKEKVYPTYKSIKDIREYEPDGQHCEYVLFEPEKKLPKNGGTEIKYWRLIDDTTDWTIIENSGVFMVSTERTFVHEFGKVPAIIVSDIEKVGTYERLSPIEPILELAKDYARDKSILTIYKFLQGFPLHWRYVSNCKACTGTGKVGTAAKKTDCTACDGKGKLINRDVTDVVMIDKPTDKEEPIIAPDLAGFISPDLETWTKYSEDMRDLENIMYDTIWGTDKLRIAQKSDNKTATGEFLDVQPTTNTLNGFTDNVEYVHNTLANFVVNFVDTIKEKSEVQYAISYGRRYILESPDIILEKYQKAKAQNDNNTILDKLLEEFVLSKYKSDPMMQELMLKKIKVEPYVHDSISTIKDLLGPSEAYKKVLFQKFWEQADTEKTAEQLTEEFNQYFTTNESSKTLSPADKT